MHCLMHHVCWPSQTLFCSSSFLCSGPKQLRFPGFLSFATSVVVIRQVSEIRKIRLELRNGAFLKASAPILPSASELSFIRPFLIIFTFSASGPFTEQWTHFGLFRSRYFLKSLHSSIHKKIVEMAIQFNGFSVMIFKKSAVVCLVSW